MCHNLKRVYQSVKRSTFTGWVKLKVHIPWFLLTISYGRFKITGEVQTGLLTCHQESCLTIKMTSHGLKQQTPSADLESNGLTHLPLVPYMRQWTRSALVQKIVAYSAPSHYLNQWWYFILNWELGNKFQWNINRNSCVFIQENAFENIVWKLAGIMSRTQCVNTRGTNLSSTWCEFDPNTAYVVCISICPYFLI